MRRLRLVLVVLAGLFAISAHARWTDDGTILTDSGWKKADGGFGAMLVVTDDPESFFREWNQPAAPGYQPRISAVESAPRGDKVTAIVIFSGCTPDPLGFCRGTIEYRLTRPDGQLYAEQPVAPLWDEEAPPKGRLQVGLAQLDFAIELDDPLGEYTIDARVTDTIGHQNVSLRRRVRVVEPDQPVVPIPKTFR